MGKYVLDGQVYVQKKTGIYRYCNEVLKELDKIIGLNEIELLVPKEAVFEQDFLNIKVVRYGKGNGVIWAQTYLPLYCHIHKVIPISFYNTTPILRPGIVVIHDIAYKVFSNSYNSVYGKFSCLWHRFNYWYISKLKYKIITVSNFSKSEICKYYHVNPRRITIIGNGWQHYLNISTDESVFDDYPNIEPNSYYFSFGSLENRKNYKWIKEVAKRNQDKIFVITGNNVKNSIGLNNSSETSNLIFTGYLDDSKVKALLSHAIAFVFPTLYEGFGIPPLEALCVGTKVLCSNTSCLPEILENSVVYFNPYDYDVDLDKLVNESKISDNRYILEKYSWRHSAELFRNIYLGKESEY